MKLPLKFDFLKGKPLTSLLGLAFDGDRLQGAVVRRQNGSLSLVKSFTSALTLDPLTNDPELVGREILNLLETEGIRERRCVVALPLKWALTAHTTIPAIPDDDVANFLQLEAERGFPCDISTLRVATSRYATSTGRHATFAGISSSHLERLEQVLAAAKLKPISFSPGTTALQLPTTDTSEGVLALVIGESQIALQITYGSGVAALRALDGVIEVDSGRRNLNIDLVARETRITLGQLPPECRAAVKRVRIFGPPVLARDLSDGLISRFQTIGMTVEVVDHYKTDEFGPELPPKTSVSVAFSVAARRLTGTKETFEFLPPKISTWKQITTQYTSGKLRTAGAIAALIILCAIGAFGYQQWQLSKLNSQWDKVSVKVGELESVQQEIRRYRPWFDESFHCMTIMRELTMAFPEDGTVTAKTIEIRDQNIVTCSGTARDNAALLRMLAQLRGLEGVHDVKIDQTRGKTPMQFTFGFQYGTEAKHEN